MVLLVVLQLHQRDRTADRKLYYLFSLLGSPRLYRCCCIDEQM